MQSNGERTKTCLVGHTGFVGSALLRQAQFDDCFNSSNIGTIAGRRYGTLVCAAAPGSMFEANRDPEVDRAMIHELMGKLESASADRVILISSIAVLADFGSGDDESAHAFQTEIAYGRHRRELEVFVEDRFAGSLVVRLPALFGRGLRKNFLFDLLNPIPSMLTCERLEDWVRSVDVRLGRSLRELYAFNRSNGMFVLDRPSLAANALRTSLEETAAELGYSATHFHNRETTYQYYEVEKLWSDIGLALNAGLSHIHLVNEPLTAARIHRRLTGRPMPETAARLHREDMRTRHAGLWSKSGPYIDDAKATLERIEAFYAESKAAA